MKPINTDNDKKRGREGGGGDAARYKGETRYHPHSDSDDLKRPYKKRKEDDVSAPRRKDYDSDEDPGEIKEDDYRCRNSHHDADGDRYRSRRRELIDDHRHHHDRPHEGGRRGTICRDTDGLSNRDPPDRHRSSRDHLDNDRYERDRPYRERSRDRDGWRSTRDSERERFNGVKGGRGYGRDEYRDRDRPYRRDVESDERYLGRSGWRGRARGRDEDSKYATSRDSRRHDIGDDYPPRRDKFHGDKSPIDNEVEGSVSSSRLKERRYDRGYRARDAQEVEVESDDKRRGSWRDSDASDDEENDLDVRARRRRELERLRRMADDEGENAGDKALDARSGRISSEYLERLRQITESQKRQREEINDQKLSKAADAAAPLDEEAMDISDHSDLDDEGGAEVVPVALDEETALLQEVMGFKSFETTKGRKHEVTIDGCVSKKTKRKYRQYMNRKGGFNRPLSPVF